ncbi:uncharacterized protein LOC143017521 [Oratosquilla oratoria]|uniref:uncharacterized protein LOC143017521 n=1 Tax=Oratosquilla oratoria TaxID=337810 RepID=UPI003F75CED9
MVARIISTLLALSGAHPLGDYSGASFSNPVSFRHAGISNFGKTGDFSGSGIATASVRPGILTGSDTTGAFSEPGGFGGFHGSVGGFDGPVGTSGVAGFGVGVGFGGGHGVGPCGVGEVRKVDGTCARPQVTRNFYVYDAPKQEEPILPPPHIPDPKIDYNLIFIRTPENQGQSDPIVIPPPEQRTVVYVLNKEDENSDRKVIEVLPPPSQEPEVFFINYQDGENPQLPGGIDLHTALGSAVAQNGGFPRGDVSGFEEAGGFGGAGGLGVAGGLAATGSHSDAGGFALGFDGSGGLSELARAGGITRANVRNFASLGSSGSSGGSGVFSDAGNLRIAGGSSGFSGSGSLAGAGPGSFSDPVVPLSSSGSPFGTPSTQIGLPY